MENLSFELSVDQVDDQIVYEIVPIKADNRTYVLRHRVYSNGGLLLAQEEEQFSLVEPFAIAFEVSGFRTEGQVLYNTQQLSKAAIHLVLPVEPKPKESRRKVVIPDAVEVEETVRDDGPPIQTGEDNEETA